MLVSDSKGVEYCELIKEANHEYKLISDHAPCNFKSLSKHALCPHLTEFSSPQCTERHVGFSQAYADILESQAFAPTPPKPIRHLGVHGKQGFIFGTTATGLVGYYYLLEEYNMASAKLLSSVEELEQSTEKIREYAQRMEAVERDITKLKSTSVTQQQLGESKTEFRKLYDTLNMDHLELKAYVWRLEKDLHDSNNERSL